MLISADDILACDPSERVLGLRARLRNSIPALCAERAVILTRAFQEMEGVPVAMRWARALDAVLREMTIYIDPGELIVGNQASSHLAAPIFPEASTQWLLDDLDQLESRAQDPFQVPADVGEEIREISTYWSSRCMQAQYQGRVHEDVSAAEAAHAIRIKSSGGIGHQLLHLDRVLTLGMEGIGEEIGERLERGRAEGADPSQVNFWRALIHTCDSICAFASRYAALANQRASDAVDPQRRSELERIAEVCSQVPAKAARSLHEALQVVWFMTLLGHIFQSGGGVTIGRLDQILNPYFQQDLRSGQVQSEFAQELLDCLWLKLQDLNVVRPTETVVAWAGYEVNPTVNIGGVDIHGNDATNEVSFMCLASERHIHMRNPQLILRVHARTPDRLWRAAIDVIRLGGGKPSLISDRVCMQALSRLGVPEKELREYSVIGCAEPVAGDSRIMVRWSWLCLPKVLELTLHAGTDPLTGAMVGVDTGPPARFSRFEDLLHAFRRQVEHQVRLIVKAVNETADPLVAEWLPHLPWSLLSPSSIRRGMDLGAGGAALTWSVVWPIAPATTADSLAAIKKVLFDDQSATWDDLLEAMQVNFEGHEPLRQRLLHAPKFGNDDATADEIAGQVVEAVYDALDQHRNRYGGPFTTGFITLGANVHYGRYVGATPDGRLKGRPLSDGMSPVQGCESQGPTASLMSVAGLDLARAGSGGILNQKFNPGLLSSAEGIQSFIDLNQTYLNELGGLQVQYNVVSTETLRAAQADPDLYKDLLVRVVGYCARFIDLSPEVQEDIIARTEHRP
jgi:pyruvate formate-lyase/glycerol dehydratase family glycyl radical enzyme